MPGRPGPRQGRLCRLEVEPVRQPAAQPNPTCHGGAVTLAVAGLGCCIGLAELEHGSCLPSRIPIDSVFRCLGSSLLCLAAQTDAGHLGTKRKTSQALQPDIHIYSNQARTPLRESPGNHLVGLCHPFPFHRPLPFISTPLACPSSSRYTGNSDSSISLPNLIILRHHLS